MAQSLSYTTFNAKEKQAFIKRWKISEEEYLRYQQVMRVEGQRYNGLRLTPLDILGITAESDELMQYYAKKAAIDERETVKKQMKFILLTTQYKRAFGEEERANNPELQKQVKLFKDAQINKSLEKKSGN